MKIDHTGQTIRRIAQGKGFQVELEQITDLDGTARRFWFFFTGRGQPLTNGEGAGLQDAAALRFLSVPKTRNGQDGR